MLLEVEGNLKSVCCRYNQLWKNLPKNRSYIGNCKMPFGGVEKLILHRHEHEVAFKYLSLYNIFPFCFCYNRKNSACHLHTGRNV